MRWLALHCLWWFVCASSWLLTTHLEHVDFSLVLSHCDKAVRIATWTGLIRSLSKTSLLQLFWCFGASDIAIPAKLFEIRLKHHFNFNLILKYFCQNFPMLWQPWTTRPNRICRIDWFSGLVMPVLSHRSYHSSFNEIFWEYGPLSG